MGIYSKPLDKELVKDPSHPGFTCSICGNKYRAELSKIRCEKWHEVASSS